MGQTTIIHLILIHLMRYRLQKAVAFNKIDKLIG